MRERGSFCVCPRPCPGGRRALGTRLDQPVHGDHLQTGDAPRLAATRRVTAGRHVGRYPHSLQGLIRHLPHLSEEGRADGLLSRRAEAPRRRYGDVGSDRLDHRLLELARAPCREGEMEGAHEPVDLLLHAVHLPLQHFACGDRRRFRAHERDLTLACRLELRLQHANERRKLCILIVLADGVERVHADRRLG